MRRVLPIQAFKKAVEEALELQARRAGQTPATNHRPLDFLGPGAVGAASDSEGPEEEDDLEDLRPPPADEAVAQCISAARAAAWLRAAACTDTSTLAEVFSPMQLQCGSQHRVDIHAI